MNKADLHIHSSYSDGSDDIEVLAEKIKEDTHILRTLKKPGELPDIQEFRFQASSALEAHNAELSKINSGAVSTSQAHVIMSAGRIRIELCRCFDELLEIMFNNI